MPELPEVETIRRQIEPRLDGRAVLDAGSHWSAKFTPATAVIGDRLLGAGRRGKYLLLPTETGREVVVHLGMTGALRFAPSLGASSPEHGAALDDPYVRAWWRLGPGGGSPSGETLLYVDVRRFGRIRVVAAGDYAAIPTLALAGPEPFDPAFDGDRFWALLQQSKRRIKTQLLSQRPVAGVGNIYADEALWLASINPRVTRLGRTRAAELLAALRHVLRQGIDNGGTTLRDYRTLDGSSGTNQGALSAYGRAGKPCRRCRTELRAAVIDARTTTWCPDCQRR
ncbi:MAG: bifunctional DNA-formamidopyrimidine glycosylase/DNA-(apurinic or apyrimidinic site) lyase [Acidimicrobiia bacterium]|nr:bifunctional DNA-formamidopyrimidine glycosylase/DNA-(apurinic or apyrimidinic site) lyase [Acidimicrobiia bacterium]